MGETKVWEYLAVSFLGTAAIVLALVAGATKIKVNILLHLVLMSLGKRYHLKFIMYSSVFKTLAVAIFWITFKKKLTMKSDCLKKYIYILTWVFVRFISMYIFWILTFYNYYKCKIWDIFILCHVSNTGKSQMRQSYRNWENIHYESIFMQ